LGFIMIKGTIDNILRQNQEIRLTDSPTHKQSKKHIDHVRQR
jgi:hypothetical protein